MSLWGGRFQGTSDADAWKLNASIGFDQRLAKQDVTGSIAWAQQLHKIGILNNSEYQVSNSAIRRTEGSRFCSFDPRFFGERASREPLSA